MATEKTYMLFKPPKHPVEVDEMYHVYNRQNCLNAMYWYEYFQYVNELSFDCIVECGVGRGRSLISLISIDSFFASSKSKSPHDIYAFDSFEGFPEPCEFDSSWRNSQKGEWAKSPTGKYDYTPSFIADVLKAAGLSDELFRVKFVKGYFSETCKQFDRNKSIGILHLDGDLYCSIKDPLDALFNNVVKGGLIVFDDFMLNRPVEHKEKFPGARKAAEDFLSNNPQVDVMESIRGTPYFVKK